MITSTMLLRAYRAGFFPMAVDDEIRWFSPDERGIVPLEAFRPPRRLRRVLRQERFDVTINQAFDRVLAACASRPDPDGTWIDAVIAESYGALHREGHAHSVETWRDGTLVGGLYGVALRGAFFGESMFHTESDASKVALVALVERLRKRGYLLLDVQWVTPHLARFGAVGIPRGEYLARLDRAMRAACCFV